MKLTANGIDFNVIVNEEDLNSSKLPIVFLHGFTGCAYDWNFLFNNIPAEFLPIAIDLIGHGESASPDDPDLYTCGAIVSQIKGLLSQLGIKKFVLVGYSMGGRAALSYSIKHPNDVVASVLESSTAGIEDFEQKKERVENDFLLADKIREEGIESFLEYWMNLPLFTTLKENGNVERIKAQKNKNSIYGLSNSLSGFSTGLMKSYWNDLPKLDFPVLLITGELDNKFTTINKRMHTLLPNSTHKIIPKAGHNTHLEKPDVFTNFVLEFIQNIKGKHGFQLD